MASGFRPKTNGAIPFSLRHTRWTTTYGSAFELVSMLSEWQFWLGNIAVSGLKGNAHPREQEYLNCCLTTYSSKDATQVHSAAIAMRKTAFISLPVLIQLVLFTAR